MALSKDNAQAINADFLDFLAVHFPQWLSHVRTERDEDADQDFLELSVPAPSAVVHDRPLEISTWGEEITVSFGDYHTHFPWPVDHDGLNSRDKVLDLIRAVLNEDLVTVSVWHHGRCKFGSTALSAGLDRYREIAAGDHKLHITSWRGTYDAVLSVDWHSYLQTLSGNLQIFLKASDP